MPPSFALNIDPLIAWPGLIACGIGAATDVARHKIYNWLTFPLLTAGPLVQFALHGPVGLVASVGGMALVVLVLLGLFVSMGINFGGGDLKLLFALGALVGWPLIASLLMYTGVGGLLVAIPVLLYRRKMRYTLTNLAMNYQRREAGDSTVSAATNSTGGYLPYGVCIFIGMVTLALRGGLF